MPPWALIVNVTECCPIIEVSIVNCLHPSEVFAVGHAGWVTLPTGKDSSYDVI